MPTNTVLLADLLPEALQILAERAAQPQPSFADRPPIAAVTPSERTVPAPTAAPQQ